MKLILVRHAIATPREQAANLPDEQRALTPEGIRKMRRVVTGLQRLDLGIEQIWTSPLLRAAQTAELLRSGLPVAERVHEVSELRPDGDMEYLLQRIAEAHELGTLALIGHEPYLSDLMCRLLSMDGRCSIEFKKGGVACFEVDTHDSAMSSTLLWFLTPKQLRMLSRKHC